MALSMARPSTADLSTRVQSLSLRRPNPLAVSCCKGRIRTDLMCPTVFQSRPADQRAGIAVNRQSRASSYETQTSRVPQVSRGFRDMGSLLNSKQCPPKVPPSPQRLLRPPESCCPLSRSGGAKLCASIGNGRAWLASSLLLSCFGSSSAPVSEPHFTPDKARASSTIWIISIPGRW